MITHTFKLYPYTMHLKVILHSSTNSFYSFIVGELQKITIYEQNPCYDCYDMATKLQLAAQLKELCRMHSKSPNY